MRRKIKIIFFLRFGYTITHTPLPRGSKQLSVNLTPDTRRPHRPASPTRLPAFIRTATAAPATPSPTLPPLTTVVPFHSSLGGVAHQRHHHQQQPGAPLKIPPRTKGLPLSAPVGAGETTTASPNIEMTTVSDFGFLDPTERPRSGLSSTARITANNVEQATRKPKLSIGLTRESFEELDGEDPPSTISSEETLEGTTEDRFERTTTPSPRPPSNAPASFTTTIRPRPRPTTTPFPRRQRRPTVTR